VNAKEKPRELMHLYIARDREVGFQLSVRRYQDGHIVLVREYDVYTGHNHKIEVVNNLELSFLKFVKWMESEGKI